MISEEFIIKLAIKWQTSEINVIREYVQHHFLASFYKEKQANNLYFKGGTALRIIYQSPRFSEDLDFTSIIYSVTTIERLIEEALMQLSYSGIKIDITEAKPTTGGYFFNSKTRLFSRDINIKLNFVFKKQAKGEAKVIASVFLPPYNLISLEQKVLLYEKVTALLTRHKIRDYFDLYFIMRAYMGKEAIGDRIKEATKLIERTNLDFKELKQFLPKSFWPVVKDLKKNLLSELRRL